MTQYEWVAQKSNHKARNLVFVLLAAAFVFMLIPMIFPAMPFRWGIQLIALCLLTAGIFMTTRYLTRLYIYRIVGEGDALDLTVTEAASNGKRQITVCRVALSRIHRLAVFDAATPDVEKKERGLLKGRHIKQYDYRPDLRPEKSIFLIVEEGGEELGLFLSYDEELFSQLSREK